MTNWTYTLTETDEDGKILQEINATEEVQCLYTQIEFLEKVNEGFKNFVLDKVISEEVRH